ncbi:YueI family protein [uncultured Marinococcus sp.]|uniref:YueI family protein n=1 Tax=uncultured Marinococcus sp. TaxID=487012 RepID=UPI00262319D6|nr:YueI family protein [uncultured Marinococcus sp.]
MSNDVNEHLQNEIHGKKLPNEAERRLYLDTYRERVILALTKKQVMEKGIRQEVLNAMHDRKAKEVLVDGHLSLEALRPYRKAAETRRVPYRRVTLDEPEDSYGLVVTSDTAINREDVLAEDEPEENSKEAAAGEKKPWWKKLLGI